MVCSHCHVLVVLYIKRLHASPIVVVTRLLVTISCTRVFIQLERKQVARLQIMRGRHAFYI